MMWVVLVMLGLVVGIYLLLKYWFNMTVRHEIIEVNITPQQAAEVVNKAFGVKPWKQVDGPGDINRKYTTFFTAVNGPVISVAFGTLENGLGTHVDIWMSDGEILTRKTGIITTEAVKFDGKIRSKKKGLLRALAENRVEDTVEEVAV